MLIRNASPEHIHQAANETRIRATVNPATGRSGYRVTLQPLPQSDTYRKLSTSYFNRGRRTNAVCFHGHYAFLTALYRLAPTTRVTSRLAHFDSVQDLHDKAPQLSCTQMGPPVAPIEYRYACECE